MYIFVGLIKVCICICKTPLVPLKSEEERNILVIIVAIIVFLQKSGLKCQFKGFLRLPDHDLLCVVLSVIITGELHAAKSMGVGAAKSLFPGKTFI